MRKMMFTDCVDIVGNRVEKFEGNKKYISTGSLDCDHIDFGQVEDVTFVSRPSRANLIANSGDLLFAKMHGTKKTIILDKKSENYIYSTGFCAVRPQKNIINGRCLYHIITSDEFLQKKDKNCSGATQKAITNVGLEKIQISIPEFGLQNEIADKLDAVDKALTICYGVKERLDKLVKSRFGGLI